MSAQAEAADRPRLSDPKEVAKTFAEVCQRASKLIAEHMQRQINKGITPPTDELGIARAFMDMMAMLASNPYRLAQTQMHLGWDHCALWQHSMLRFAGLQSPPAAEPTKGDNRFKDEQWQDHLLFDFIKQ